MTRALRVLLERLEQLIGQSGPDPRQVVEHIIDAVPFDACRACSVLHDPDGRHAQEISRYPRPRGIATGRDTYGTVLAEMRNTARRLRRWRTRRCVENFLAVIARSLAKEDPASEHYYWKIAAQKQTRFHRTRERLILLLGIDAADRLLRGCARRARSPRRAVLVVAALVWFAPTPLATVRAPIVVFATPLALMVGSVFRQRHIKQAASLLGGAEDDLLEDFAPGDVRRAVRRFRRSVPAAALSRHPRQEILANHLGENDPETLEIAGKLADEFAGTALELLEAARNLR